MKIFYLITFFILGSLFGSFLTVVGCRLPKGEDFIKKRSHCDKCGHELSLLDMVPFISYFCLKGRCRYCKTKFGSLSNWMDFFTGVLFALAYFVFGFSWELLIALGIIAMLIIISVTDISYYIIPDEVLIFFSCYFIVIKCLSGGFPAVFWGVLSGAALFAVMYLIMLLGDFLFKKESLGGGDIKMMFVFGLIVNPFMGFIVIFLSSFLALPVSLLILYKKKNNLVPFGPFLLISFMFVYFTQIDMNMIFRILGIE